MNQAFKRIKVSQELSLIKRELPKKTMAIQCGKYSNQVEFRSVGSLRGRWHQERKTQGLTRNLGARTELAR